MNLFLIFDIDGVLINVENSFHQAIKETVPLYVEKILGLPVDNLCVKDSDIAHLKHLGGFNDDWDVTAGLLYYFVSLLDNNKQIVKDWDVGSFIDTCKGQGIPAILNSTRHLHSDWVYFDKSPVSTGKIHPQNKVKRIFQEIYWGQSEFERVYHEPPCYYFGDGCIQQEVPLLNTDQLNDYQKMSLGLAIATGRERDDALYSLQKFSYLDAFDTIVTLTDVGENRKKPHPHSLLTIDQFFAEKGFESREYIYVGDQIDDMAMAVSAQDHMRVMPVGFLYEDDAVRRRKMVELGVTNLVDSHDKVVDIIKQRKQSCG